MQPSPQSVSPAGERRHPIEVADQTLHFRALAVADVTPTGTQLAAAAGFKPSDHASVLHLLASGELEDLRPDEVVDLRESTRRFVIVPSDRSYRVTVDGVRFDWPVRVISGGVVRKLGRVPPQKDIYLQRRDVPDRLIEAHDLVDLDSPGVESFESRDRIWKLNVQGVVLELTEPTIIVREAMTKAGFDTTKAWHIFLKVAGQPKRPVTLTEVIDLRTPGIEKLRLTPKEVNNGEALPAPRRTFALLEVDELYLDGLGLLWETVIDAQRRWLLIHGFPVPRGYKATRVLLALEIPPTYPGAQIDMFYSKPELLLSTGRAIDRTQPVATILGETFNGWSRHRSQASPWDPAKDNVKTHIALVEGALLKEVGE
jgi:hypothetical protein